MDEPALAGNGHVSEGAVLSKLAWSLRSGPGKVRETNEDYVRVYAPTIPDDAWNRGPLFAVADGLGGHAAGEVASRLAVEAILRVWTADQPDEPVKALRAAARQANTVVLDASFAPQRSAWRPP